MSAFISLSPVSLADVLAVYTGSDGDATRDLYARLQGCGPLGLIVLNMFRAEKASEHAKQGRRYKSANYDKKNWSMALLTDALSAAKGWDIAWGWAVDPNQDFHRHVLYVETPAGQVSFHAESRGAGPDYAKPWDGIKGQGPTRIGRWVVDLLNANVSMAGVEAATSQAEFNTIISVVFGSETEKERKRFEQWAAKGLAGPCEASVMFARTIGGDYVNRAAIAAWAGWQARGLLDAESK